MPFCFHPGSTDVRSSALRRACGSENGRLLLGPAPGGERRAWRRRAGPQPADAVKSRLHVCNPDLFDIVQGETYRMSGAKRDGKPSPEMVRGNGPVFCTDFHLLAGHLSAFVMLGRSRAQRGGDPGIHVSTLAGRPARRAVRGTDHFLAWIRGSPASSPTPWESDGHLDDALSRPRAIPKPPTPAPRPPFSWPTISCPSSATKCGTSMARDGVGAFEAPARRPATSERNGLACLQHGQRAS